jgi:hypothetical protein
MGVLGQVTLHIHEFEALLGGQGKMFCEGEDVELCFAWLKLGRRSFFASLRVSVLEDHYCEYIGIHICCHCKNPLELEEYIILAKSISSEQRLDDRFPP